MRNLICLILIFFLVGCTGPQQLGMSKLQWQALDSKQQKALVKTYEQLKEEEKFHKVYAGPKLNIHLSPGMAMMPPFDQSYAFNATQFSIIPGECKLVPLFAQDGKHRVELQVCYNGLRLAFDPSRVIVERSKGTVFFDYNPIWKRGFTYFNVESNGYTRLRDTNIRISTIAETTRLTDDNHPSN